MAVQRARFFSSFDRDMITVGVEGAVKMCLCLSEFRFIKTKLCRFE